MPTTRSNRSPGTTSALLDWWLEERQARERGYRIVAGIDEAGRGALAGPLVAACVVLPFRVSIEVDDSKKLTPARREVLCAEIRRAARGLGVGTVPAALVDRLNVLRASEHAMRLALACLPRGLFPDVALIDGNPVVPFPLDQVALVGGDGRCASIAAASIVAKVARDALLDEMHSVYPQFGFSSHKGYATSCHLAALRRHGPCPEHRRSYRPVSECLGLCEQAIE